MLINFINEREPQKLEQQDPISFNFSIIRIGTKRDDGVARYKLLTVPIPKNEK